MAKKEEKTLPTEEEIRKLPRRAIVAFAARCARRVEPLFAFYWPDAPKKHRKAVARTVDIAEQIAASDAKDFTRAARAASDAERAARLAARLAASFAIEAARAARAAASLASDAAGSTLLVNNASLARTAAFIAYSTASAAYATKAAATVTRYYIRADFKKLIKAAKEEEWTDDTPVSPEFFGPLWPNGEPDWEKIPERPMPKFRGSEPMSLYFDRAEFNNKDIAEIISMLSELYHGIGGDRLVIDRTMQFAIVDEPVPEGV